MSIERLRALIGENYEIGVLTSVKKLEKGYVNISYEIETSGGGQARKYFLREYKKGIKEEEIRFEHSIVNHLVKKKLTIVAPVIRARDGRTYTKEFMESRDDEEGEPVFLAVFELLPGEDRYTWDNPVCSDQELRNSASVLAQYHEAVIDLVPEGKRYEPRIIDHLPLVVEKIMHYSEKAGRTEFDSYFLENFERILKAIDRIRSSVEEKAYKAMIHLAIHCDYHPGNLKFQNGNVTGLFDFDWSKIDARSFDVALAITYFCAKWEGQEDGDLQLDRAGAFLQAYQETLARSQQVGPLGEIELRYLPPMIGASNIYVLNWDLDDFYSKEVNPKEYARYLRHNVRLMKWLEDEKNLEKLKKTIEDAS